MGGSKQERVTMGPRDWRRAQLIYKILSAIKVPLAEEQECRSVP